MNTRTLWTLGWLAPAVLVACATNHPKVAAAAGKVNAPDEVRGATSCARINWWSGLLRMTAPSLVNSVDRSLYQARFKGQCNGLRLVDTIAFIVQTAAAGRQVRRGRTPGWDTLCIHVNYATRDRAPPPGKSGPRNRESLTSEPDERGEEPRSRSGGGGAKSTLCPAEQPSCEIRLMAAGAAPRVLRPTQAHSATGTLAPRRQSNTPDDRAGSRGISTSATFAEFR